MGAGQSRAAGRLLPVDVLKAVASQLIVLHHLAFYGPMSDVAAALWPALFEFLSRHGRLAVQVFLVVGGFLAARSLAPEGRLPDRARPVALAVQRYLRLVLPYAVVLAVAVVASAWAGRWMSHPSISAPATTWQVLAHLLLLQDLLGFEALSAGLWYVAIDFQLFALLLGVLAAARHVDRGGVPVAPWAVLALAAVSILYVNREPAWDVAAPYYFGSYALGVLVAWRGVRGGRAVLLLGLAVAATGLWLEWRWRIAASVATSLLLLVWLEHRAAAGVGRGTADAAWGWLSRISYGVFLVHFPVSLVVNAAFTRFVPLEPAWQLAGVVTAWAASVLAGAAFHRWVERPVQAWAPSSGRLPGLRALSS